MSEAVVGEPITLDPPTVMAPLTEWFNNNRFVVPYHTMGILIEKGFTRDDGRRCDLRGSVVQKVIGDEVIAAMGVCRM